MKMGLSKAKNPAKIDFLLLILLLLMAAASLLSIYSTFGLTGADGPGYLIRQVMWYVIGFIAIAFMVYLGNDSIMDFAKIAYWILMVCLIALLMGQIYYRLRGET
ncbi:MAG: FtsW/RodA/SpoVE family cell cycle protein, partial [Longicatena sp.]